MEDEFDDGAPILAPAGRSGKKGASLSTEGAIRFIDEKWYRAIAKRGRWMDLIGDYAGSERFILDGKTVSHNEDILVSLIGRGNVNRRSTLPARSRRLVASSRARRR